MRSPDPATAAPLPSMVAGIARLREQPVLVTGATGFVGSNLVHALVGGGAEVHLVARPTSSTWRIEDVLGRVHVHHASLTDGDALGRAFDAARPRVVLHLATPRGGDADAGARIVAGAVLGALHVLRLSRQHAVERLVVTGSSLEYRPSDAPLSEASPIEPVTAHGAAKAAATLLCLEAARDSGTPVCVLRLFHVYGPRESRHRLLPTIIRAARSGEPLPLTPGDGARDWIHVDDVVEALLRSVDGDDARGEVINVGSGLEHTNDAIVSEVERAMGRPVRVLKGAFALRGDHSAHRRADRGKAGSVLGWAPRFGLRDGIADTVAWFEANPSALSHGADRPPAVV